MVKNTSFIKEVNNVPLEKIPFKNGVFDIRNSKLAVYGEQNKKEKYNFILPIKFRL